MRVTVAAVLGALLLQFLMGTWLNLFAAFPPELGSYSGMIGMMSFMFSGGMPVLMVHMMMGYLLLLLSMVVLVASIQTGDARTVFLGAVGLASVLLASVSGLDFMFSGFQNNIYSYLMAVGFVVAFMVYSLELSLAR